MIMYQCIPDFEMDDEYAMIPTAATTNKLAPAGEEDIMELLWQNGQVVLRSQNQRSFKKSPTTDAATGTGEAELPSYHHQQQQSSHQQQQQHLFMQEDEMASWLHYPLDDSSFDRDIYSDFLYPPPSSSAPTISTTTATPSPPPREIRTIVTEIRPLTPAPPPPAMPPPPPTKGTDVKDTAPSFQNFVHFSRLPEGRKEMTVVDSNETPTVERESIAADSTARVSGGNLGCGTMSCTPTAGTSTAARDLTTACDLTVTSSPGGTGSSISATTEPPPVTAHKPSTSSADDRKRKGRETDEAECQSEDIEFESADAKGQARGSTSTKRSRAAEVHNLSERRRRDRINEKMRALQELIPRCNKSDKASMLDEAIEYLKALQLQVQLMAMGCGMLPMMYPGVQQYMPAMAMGMGMGMDMGMNRPIMPYPSLMPGSGVPSPVVTANMGPRFPVPAFHMQPVSVPDSSRIQAPNQLDPMLNSLVAHDPNHPRLPNFVDPYQHYIGLHQARIPLQQNQVVVQPNKPSSRREVGSSENHQSG